MHLAPAASDATQLPRELSSFVGRERQIEQIRAVLAGARLVTLTGPGGVGKTRLALEVAAEWHRQNAQSVVFVALAQVVQSGLVVPAIARALGIQELERRALLQTLEDALRDRALLLVLDNFEHVIPAASAITTLLAQCPRVQALVTSRTVLRSSGEHVFALPPLEVPAANNGGVATVAKISQFEAVRLYVDRAKAARSDFELTDETATAVASICRRLDGLPLAISLAAAHVRMLPPAALLDRLERGLPLPVRGQRDHAERHQTLRRAVGWSYDLLAPAEQRVFRAVAVFAGGCTLDNAEAVANDSTTPRDLAVLHRVSALIDASLLRQVDLKGEPRLTMLETIREFGLEQLATSGEETIVRRRHWQVFLGLAERELPWTWHVSRLNVLDRESSNLYAAIRSAVDQGEGQIGLRLTAGLWPLWLVRGRYGEGRACLAELLSLPSAAAPTAARVNALDWAAYLAYRQLDFDAAARLAEESIAVTRAVGTDADFGGSSLVLGNLARERGEFELAHVLYDQAEKHNPLGGAFAHIQHSLTFFEQSNPDQAEAAATEALRMFRKMDNPSGIALALQTLGRVASSRRDFIAAARLIEQALVLQRAVDDINGVQWSVRNLAYCELDQGDIESAIRRFGEALLLATQTGDRAAQARCLEGLGAALVSTDPFRAVRFGGAAAAIWKRIDASPLPAEADRTTAWLSAALRSLRATRFRVGWAEGRRLPTEAILAEALQPETGLRRGRSHPAVDRTTADPLTPREREVVRLLARGVPAREIALTLVISDGTVRSHVEHVLAKLHLRSRVQLASWAVQHGYLLADA